MVSTVFVILHLVMIILYVLDADFSDSIGQVDPAYEEAWQEQLEGYEMLQIILDAIWIVCGTGAIVSAVVYRVWPLYLYVLFLVACAITDITFQVQTCNEFENECNLKGLPIFLELLFVSLNIYPCVGFIVEVRKGIMSKETYPREEYSCFCT